MKKYSIFIILIIVIKMFYSCEYDLPNDIDDIEEENLSPEIISLTAAETTLESDESVLIICTASDPEGDNLSYTWESTGGEFGRTYGGSVQWYAPNVETESFFIIIVKVNDGINPPISKQIFFTVFPSEPEIHTLELKTIEDTYIDPNSRDQNWGSRQDLVVSDGKIPYFKFNISNLPKDATITTAYFRPIIGYNNSIVKPYGNVVFYHVSSMWSEYSLTYNNRILSGNNYVSGISNVKFDEFQVLEVDVAFELEDYIKNPPLGSELVYNRFCMKIESSDGGYFYSREVSGYEATLYVEYTID